MKDAKDIPQVPAGLLQSIADGRCILFAGAGLSRGRIEGSAGATEQYLPGWGDLLGVLVQWAADQEYVQKTEAAKLRKAVKDRKYLFVAETVKRLLGAREYDEALESVFRRRELQPTIRHRLITQIPFAGVVTTNYDKLLETAYAGQGCIPPTYTFDDAPDVISALSHDRFFVLKAHGDIDRKSSIVLSERDHRDIIYRQPGYRAALNTVFITKTVFFVGTSLNDTDVLLVLEAVSEAFSGKGPKHYALVPEQQAGTAELQHWRDFFGIELIQYRATKGHPAVDGFLNVLGKKVQARMKKDARA